MKDFNQHHRDLVVTSISEAVGLAMAMNNEVETIVQEKVQEYLMRWI